MTLFQYFLFWYLIPLTINVIFFFILRKTIERLVSEYILYYLKMTFFVPVINILQSISFTVCTLIIIKSEIIYYYARIKFFFVGLKERREQQNSRKRLETLLKNMKKLIEQDIENKNKIS